ncbi:hypothetical protein MHAE_00290 [Mycobacterium haemophilum DSM 44634]|nr:hypothetical protein [Mycobacterium haemophilum DSM 44634]
MTAYFVFDDTEMLVCERIYFDTPTMMKQLLSPVTVTVVDCGTAHLAEV